MSWYTVQLKKLYDGGFNFGLDKYPIFDSEYRFILNQKILEHYMFYEIGFETPALFKHYLNTRMNEIMPYYNQLYNSELLEFNPLWDTDYKRKDDRTNLNDRKQDTTGSLLSETKSKNEDTSNTQSVRNDNENITGKDKTDLNQKHVRSDTPNNLLVIDDIISNNYASQADINHDTSVTDSTQERQLTSNNNTDFIGNTDFNSNLDTNTTGNLKEDITNIDDYLSHVYGNTGRKNFSELLNDYRNSFLNIDVQIIEELDDLFFGLWRI